MAGETLQLRIESLRLELGRFALDDIDLTVPRGEYHILLGPTGSGKSTLLKSLLGLHRIDRGRVHLGDREITRELPERRGMGYVPQNYALFPHMNVEQNIRFGIRARRPPAEDAAGLLEDLLALLKIEHLRDRSVRNLSGGERQKTAMARALGTQPEILLLDEPFSSIDAAGRRRLWFEIKHIISEIGLTALHITHDLEEAHVLGDRVSALIEGKLIQTGPPQEILERPAAESVARFLNFRNIFHGAAEPVEGGTRIDAGPLAIVVENEFPRGERVTVCIRQQDIKILKPDEPVRDFLKRNVFEGRLTRLFPAPESCTAWFQLAGSDQECDLELRFPRYLVIRHDLAPGKKVAVAFWEPSIICWRGGLEGDSPR
jgi:ABC-type Fe3+/spermidine/putrescine transport system ATPase subunit